MFKKIYFTFMGVLILLLCCSPEKLFTPKLSELLLKEMLTNTLIVNSEVTNTTVFNITNVNTVIITNSNESIITNFIYTTTVVGYTNSLYTTNVFLFTNFVYVTNCVVTNFEFTNLVVEWLFTTNLLDTSIFNNDGEGFNLIYSQDRYLNPFSCCYFNGSSSYIIVKENSVLDLANEFTISVWVYSLGISGDHFIISRTPENGGWGLLIAPSGQVQWCGGGMGNHYSNSIIAINEWVHVVVRREQTGRFCFFIDGNFDKDISSVNTVPGVGDVNIGSWFPFRAAVFYGYLDDIRIFNKALTEANIFQLFSM